MRILFTAILLVIANYATAQQVNPVPDYTFANRMSAGRNTVTDTAAYFSIGPRYGAVRGMMPPMVVDTASVSGNKRNGLLIFSVQKNKFLYWDSVGVKWAEMAGTGGSAINSGDTAAMLNSYTRGSGTVNYVPKFTGIRTLGNSQIFDNGTSVGIANTSPTYTLDVTGTMSNSGSAYFAYTSGLIGIGTTSPTAKLEVVSTSSSIDVGIRARSAGTGTAAFLSVVGNTDAGASYNFIQSTTNNGVEHWRIHGPGIRKTLAFRTDTFERARIDSNGNFAIATTTPTEKLDVNGRARIRTIDSTATAMNMLYVDANGVIKKSPIIGSQQVGIGIASPTSNGGADAGLVHVHTPTSGAWSIAHFTNGTTGSTGSDGLFMGSIGNDVYIFNYENAPIRLSTNAAERMRITADGEILMGSTTDAGAFVLQVTGAIYNTTTITTGAPASGSAKPWRLGEVATVSPTSPNRTIRVEIDGTVYYIHAKTTND